MPDAETITAQLLRFGRELVAEGLVVGAGGNLSARLPAGDEIIITPSGYSLAELEPEDLVRMGLDGGTRAGRAAPSSEWQMHIEAYLARPDAQAVFHLHPTVSTLLHAIGRPIRLITTDHAYYVREMRSVPYLPSGTIELAQAVAAQLAESDVVLLKHHGCLLTATGLEAAYHRAVNLEAAAMATYRAVLLGDETTVCPPEYMERIRGLEAAAGSSPYGRH
jgi:L-fuculose-phosphate aldolase